MKAPWKYRLDLRDCELEDRLLPATPNAGAVVLTTGGYVLVMSPFPVNAANPFGAAGSPDLLTSSTMTGAIGGSGVQTGTGTAASGGATSAPTGTSGGAPVTIVVGSGANDLSALNIQPVTRNTIANDRVTPPPEIGRMSGDRSAVLALGQVYRGGIEQDAPGRQGGQDSIEGPVQPLPIRAHVRTQRLASAASSR